MSKKASAVKEQSAVPKTLEELILNFHGGKYTIIPLAAHWAKVLKRREENRHLTSNEILELALRQILSGEVDWKDLKKAMTANGSSDASGLNGIDLKVKD